MKNVTLDNTTVLQLDADGTDSALDAAADCECCAMTLPSTCAPSPIRGSEARNSPSIRPKTCAGPLHSMLPAIDMPEPMQEPIPAFVVGSGVACSTTERCGCTISLNGSLSMTSAAFAAAFSGALLLKLLNMSASFFAGMQCRMAQKAVVSDQRKWRTLRLGCR